MQELLLPPLSQTPKVARSYYGAEYRCVDRHLGMGRVLQAEMLSPRVPLQRLTGPG